MLKIIKNVEMVLPAQIIKGSITFSNIIEHLCSNAGDIKGSIIEKEQVIDGSGLYLTPGFIDIHIHGTGGYDTMDREPQAITEISKILIKSGVTSFLPTTMTMFESDIRNALENIKSIYINGTEGARVLGANIEGPFINKQYKGAQKEDYIISPRISLLEDYFDILKIVTVAPEIKGAEELIRNLSSHQIIVSAGHSGATYQEIIEAKKWGLTHFTHLFNAMTGFHHRQPGIVGSALESDLTCELIADFIHVHPVVLKIVFKIKKLSEIILITDQMRAGSLGDGEFELGGQKVIVKNGEARLEDGQLAGSVLTLDQAVRNINSLNVLTLPEIIAMVTINPARILDLDHQLGKLAPGYRADLVLLDKNLNVKRVFKDGEEV
jgi:N-acetylglucosamine-6-phosphate deacetylase